MNPSASQPLITIHSMYPHLLCDKVAWNDNYWFDKIRYKNSMKCNVQNNITEILQSELFNILNNAFWQLTAPLCT